MTLRRWVPSAPLCRECGEVLEHRQLVPFEEAREGERVSEVICPNGHRLLYTLKPTQADIDRGHELAKEHGW